MTGCICKSHVIGENHAYQCGGAPSRRLWRRARGWHRWWAAWHGRQLYLHIHTSMCNVRHWRVYNDNHNVMGLHIILQQACRHAAFNPGRGMSLANHRLESRARAFEKRLRSPCQHMCRSVYETSIDHESIETPGRRMRRRVRGRRRWRAWGRCRWRAGWRRRWRAAHARQQISLVTCYVMYTHTDGDSLS